MKISNLVGNLQVSDNLVVAYFWVTLYMQCSYYFPFFSLFFLVILSLGLETAQHDLRKCNYIQLQIGEY